MIKNNKVKWLLFLFSASMIINPKFTSIGPTIILMIMTLYKIKKEKKIKYSFYEIGLGIFLLGLVISLIKAPYSVDGGIMMIKRHFRYLIIPFLLGQFRIDKKQYKSIVYGFIFGINCIFIKLIILLVQNINNINNNILTILCSNQFWSVRYGILEGNIAQTGLVSSTLILVLGTILFRIKNNKKETTFLIISLIELVIILIFTQSRSAVVSLVLILGLILLNFRKQILKYIAIILTLLITFIYQFRTSKYIERYSFKDISTLSRIEIYKESFRIFKNNPINGVGFENFKLAQNPLNYKYNTFYFHPHNMALRMLCEGGIIGFISYYFFMGLIIVKLYKRRKECKNIIGLLIILNLLIFENFEMVMSAVIGLPIIIFILAIIINSEYKSSEVIKIKNIKRNNKKD